MKNKVHSKKEYIFFCVKYCIIALLIFFVCIYRIGEHQYPVIYGDEYGYWAAGSFFAGLHWEEITTINPYYGYGYGVFLSVILRMIKDPILDYKIALYCNALAMPVIYIIVLQVEKKILFFMQCVLNEWLQICIAILVTCYPSYLQYVNYTWAEIPTIFLTWLGILCAINCLEKYNNFKNGFFLIITSVLLVMVHMRNIGFLIVSLAFLIYLNVSKRKKHYLLYVLVAGIIGFFLFWIIKNVYTGHYYVELTGNSHNSANEFGGLLNKVIKIFSFGSLKKICVGVIGKLYYFSVTSFGFGIFPLLVSFKVIQKWPKRKVLSNFELMVLFGVFFSITMILICSIYMIEYNTRFDLLLYGRYFENCIPFMMLIGILMIVSKNQIVGKKMFIYAGFLLLFITKIVELNQDYTLAKGNVFINLTPVAKWLIQNDYAKGTYVVISFFVLVILLCLFVVREVCKRVIKNVLMVAVCIVLISQNVHMARYVMDNGFFNWAIEENESELELVKLIYKLDIQDNLSYWPDNETLRADGLQYLLKYNTIRVIGEVDGTEEYVIISQRNKNSLESKGYKVIGESKRLVLWKKQFQ